MSVTSKQSHVPALNYDNLAKDLNEKFGRLVKQLGNSNKTGTTRYEIEVEFAYALNELKMCPTYTQHKHYEHANAVFSNLVNLLKKTQEEKAV